MKTPANYSRGPHTAADYGVPEAPMWSYPAREGYFNSVKDGKLENISVDRDAAMNRFPPLKSQAEIDAEGIPGPVALGVMFAATFLVVVVMVVGVWMLGLQP